MSTMSSYCPHPRDLILEWSEVMKPKQELEESTPFTDPKLYKALPVFCDWRIRRYQSLTEALAGDFIPACEDIISTGEDLQKVS